MTYPGNQNANTRGDVQTRIIEIISEYTGIAAEKISGSSDLVRDLRIAGDDGDDLLATIGREFEIDWSELDAGVIFGNEGFGLPPPWMFISTKLNGYSRNCDMYKSQVLLVSDIVEAATTGKWRQPPRVLKSPAARLILTTLSTMQYLVLAVLLVWVLASISS